MGAGHDVFSPQYHSNTSSMPMRLNAASIVNDARSEAKNFMGRNYKNMGASEFTLHAGQKTSRNNAFSSAFTSKRKSAAP